MTKTNFTTTMLIVRISTHCVTCSLVRWLGAGDSFPTSFRYYDLRLRYHNSLHFRAPAEQDLGRAFGFGGKKSRPIIMVGKGCYRELDAGKSKRNAAGRCMGLLHVNPDEKMKKIKGKDPSKVFPEDVFDVQPYRKCWTTAGHFDSRAKNENDPSWRNNPRRFLLFGRPQIGKTGTFLHIPRVPTLDGSQ